MAHLVVIKK